MSFHPFQSFLWFAGCIGIFSKPFKGRETDRHPRPRQAIAGGLQIQALDHGKPRLPWAADPDKSFIPCYAFSYGIGTYEASFIPGPPCSPFPVPKNYSLGRNLVVVAVTKKQTRGLTLFHPCLHQGREYGHERSKGTARPVAGRQCLS